MDGDKVYGGCAAKEGERYLYYSIFGSSYTDSNCKAWQKPVSNKGQIWLLRSPLFGENQRFQYVQMHLTNTSTSNVSPNGAVAPGFCI